VPPSLISGIASSYQQPPFQALLGASPIALAQAWRVLLAEQLFR
jgi:hypothetical protein